MVWRNSMIEERHVFPNELCRGWIRRQGLGFIKGQKHIDQMTKREHRSSVSSLTKDYQKNTYLSPCMECQNKVVSWEGKQPCRWTLDGTDFSTPDHQRCFKFDLNAMQDTLPSPTNFKIWNKHPLGQCFLCGYNYCTMLHIFSCCASTP